MANNNTPAFQRRQEEQRQRDRELANAAQQQRVQVHRNTLANGITIERTEWPAYTTDTGHTASIVDQMRPLQEGYLQDWATHSGVVFYDSGNRQGAPRYTAGTDPISCTADSPATYNVNGVAITALLNGDRDFVAELRAQTPHNAMTYRPSGFTMQDLDEMAARIQARARPDTAGNPEQVLARYGHLLTAADQQQLGYDSGNRVGTKAKGPKSVANFLAPPSGPTAQELAAADEWLRNSPF